ncbi:MAG: hypothetical protein Q7O66_23520 [Dehalococcoidia bacterium]|nr:hypothetical protein [Dehalococcoidia bacterium]
MTPWVWEASVTAGKALGARDAAFLERVLLDSRFEKAILTVGEMEFARSLSEEAGIHLGEAEVLAIAKRRNGLAILDDRAARALAVGLGISHTGTAGFLFEAFLQRYLSYVELVVLFQELGKVAWISPELLAAILRKAGEVQNR